VDENLVPVSSVVEERNVDPCSCRAARLVAHRPRSKGPAALDGVIDTHLARGASNGGATFHNQGGPYGRTNRAKRFVCVDVTGLPLCVRVVPASTSEASAVEQILDDLVLTGEDERLELVLMDRGTARSGATRLSAKFNYEVSPCWMGRATAQRARRQGLSPHPPCLAG